MSFNDSIGISESKGMIHTYILQLRGGEAEDDRISERERAIGIRKGEKSPNITEPITDVRNAGF